MSNATSHPQSLDAAQLADSQIPGGVDPFVLFDEEEQIYKMWFSSTTRLEPMEGKPSRMVGAGILEEMSETPLTYVFASYNADPSDDPYGPGTAPGNRKRSEMCSPRQGVFANWQTSPMMDKFWQRRNLWPLSRASGWRAKRLRIGASAPT